MGKRWSGFCLAIHRLRQELAHDERIDHHAAAQHVVDGQHQLHVVALAQHVARRARLQRARRLGARRPRRHHEDARLPVRRADLAHQIEPAAVRQARVHQRQARAQPRQAGARLRERAREHQPVHASHLRQQRLEPALQRGPVQRGQHRYGMGGGQRASEHHF